MTVSEFFNMKMAGADIVTKMNLYAIDTDLKHIYEANVEHCGKREKTCSVLSTLDEQFR